MSDDIMLKWAADKELQDENARLRAELAAEREQVAMHFKAREDDTRDIRRLIKERNKLREALEGLLVYMGDDKEHDMLAPPEWNELTSRARAVLAETGGGED